MPVLLAIAVWLLGTCGLVLSTLGVATGNYAMSVPGGAMVGIVSGLASILVYQLLRSGRA